MAEEKRKRPTRLDIIRRLLAAYGQFEATLCVPKVRVKVIDIAEDEGLVRIEVLNSWLIFDRPPRVRASQLKDTPPVPKKATSRPLPAEVLAMLERIAANPGATFNIISDPNQYWAWNFGPLMSLRMRGLVRAAGYTKRRAQWVISTKGLERLEKERERARSEQDTAGGR